MNRVSRFYKTVAVVPEAEQFQLRLDARTLRTPSRAVLQLPTEALAEAVAGEWAAQAEFVEPAAMPLTRLAFAALDTVPANRDRVIADILGFGHTDLLCYRAEYPAALVARQAAAWNPWLDWAREALGAELRSGAGITYVEQPPESLAALAGHVAARDDFTLAGLHSAAAITGSLVLALALAQGRLEAGEAHALSRLDELFQNEAWGSDTEADARARRLADELDAMARFLTLAKR